MPSPILWLFGLPSAGKTTLAKAIQSASEDHGTPTILLDGDELRAGVCSDLGFSGEARSENIRRTAEIAKLMHSQDYQVICALVTPKNHHRKLVKQILGINVRLIYVQCPLQTCIDRDVKGLYARANKGQMEGMTGVQDAFEEPYLKQYTTVSTENADPVKLAEHIYMLLL